MGGVDATTGSGENVKAVNIDPRWCVLRYSEPIATETG